MPVKKMSYKQAYDFVAWRQRCELSQEQAALTLGISTSTMWRLENSGVGERLQIWACHGVECELMRRRVEKLEKK